MLEDKDFTVRAAREIPPTLWTDVGVCALIRSRVLGVTSAVVSSATGRSWLCLTHNATVHAAQTRAAVGCRVIAGGVAECSKGTRPFVGSLRAWRTYYMANEDTLRND